MVPSAGCEGRWDHGVPASSERYSHVITLRSPPVRSKHDAFRAIPSLFWLTCHILQFNARRTD